MNIPIKLFRDIYARGFVNHYLMRTEQRMDPSITRRYRVSGNISPFKAPSNLNRLLRPSHFKYRPNFKEFCEEYLPLIVINLMLVLMLAFSLAGGS